MKTFLSLTIVLLLVSPQMLYAGAQEKTALEKDARIGKKVIVTVPGANLRTPEAVVWKSYLGETFTIALTNGEWLWIENKGGWLWDKETVPFETAIQETTARVSKEPSAENLHLRGIAYAAHAQYDNAIADYTESLKKKANNAGVLNNRGQSWYMKGDYDKAVSDFSMAIRVDSKHFVAMNNRALCRIALREYTDALNDLNAAIKLNSEYPEALNNRGVVHSRHGDYKSAIADFSAALKIDENYTDAYGNRSYAYRRQGLMKESVTDLKIAIEKNPLDYKPVNDLAWIYATSKNAEYRRPDEAVKLATKACEMTQYNASNPLDTLAAAYAASGDFAKARQWISTALEKEEPDTEESSLETHKALIFADKAISE